MRRALAWAVFAAACSPPGAVESPAEDAAPAGSTDAAPDPGYDLARAHERADAATEALLLHFWRGDLEYLGADWPDQGARAGYWIYAQALDAVLDAVERHQGRSLAGWIATLYQAQEARGWQSNFFDDENWMALALLRAYRLTGEQRYLDRADALARDVVGAWDETCCGERPGGVWWDRAHTQKATAANAGAALTAARMAIETGDPLWLEDARRIYGYWRQEMVDPDTHQVYDHIEVDGRVVKWRFTYDQGLMIGAALALHQATGEATYLDDAHAFASFLVYHEVSPTPLGDVLAETGACAGDCRQFKGIAYRYLAALEQIAGDQRHRDVLDASAYALWEIARDPASNTFAVDWSRPVDGSPVSLSQQSSAAMALSNHASLLGAAPDDGAPRFDYQAEDAALGGVGVEGSHGSFEGWGYVAGWHRDGQRIDLAVDVPDPGDYSLELRYAAGAGDAVRLVAIDGGSLVEGKRFPATAGWDEYQEISVPVHLEAGRRTVSLVFQASLGSDNFLNLDRISLEPPP